MFSLFRGKSAKFQPVVTVRKFSKNDAPKKVSETNVIKVQVTPNDISLPMHGGKRKRLRKSPAVK